jgi:hypothetical protein
MRPATTYSFRSVFPGFAGIDRQPPTLYADLELNPPKKTDSGVELMTAQVTSENFRGVLCRHCSKPVRVPNMVMKKESESHDHHDTNQTEYHLISRVFVLRCRSCEKESVYNVNQIQDFHPEMARTAKAGSQASA